MCIHLNLMIFTKIIRGFISTSQYQVLTRLAQFSLAREPHVDKVETPKAAVSMAKKTSFVVVVVIALLTIYGALV